MIMRLSNYISIGCLATLMALTACNKNVSNRTADLPALQPASQDLTAGNWKLIQIGRAHV